MRKLVLKMSVSIDGFVGGPNGEIDWILRSLDESVTSCKGNSASKATAAQLYPGAWWCKVCSKPCPAWSH